jgi:hypothetical protein
VELLRQNLDRHVAAEFLILRLINLAHSHSANLTCDLIMPERLTDHEEHLRRQPCDAMNCYLEVGPNLTKLDNAKQ